MAQAASALSPTLASIAGLPAVPVFLSTAQVLGAAPAANKRRATSQTDARAQTPETAEPAKVAPALQGAARKKAAAAAADTLAAPAASSRKRKSTEALVVPVAVSRSRRKASAASAHP
jgi:hypothetical protein